MKNLNVTIGIRTRNFRLVAQCLNQQRHRVPPLPPPVLQYSAPYSGSNLLQLQQKVMSLIFRVYSTGRVIEKQKNRHGSARQWQPDGQ